MGVPYDTPIARLRVGTRTCFASGAPSPPMSSTSSLQARRLLARRGGEGRSENITKVLYPNDEGWPASSSASSRSTSSSRARSRTCIRLLLQKTRTLREFADKFAIQLNDTHPTLAIAGADAPADRRARDGLGRGLGDHVADLRYTNHTLMPEALETWPLPLFQRLLPRHLEIVYEINRRFLDEVRARFPQDDARLRACRSSRRAIEQHVRMAHLATVGSTRSTASPRCTRELLRHDLLRDFAELYPGSLQQRPTASPRGASSRCATRASRACITRRWGPAG
jgi:starch phosphorylase